MRCPSNLLLKVTAGIIPALFVGCGGSGLSQAKDAAPPAAGGASGGETGALPSTGGTVGGSSSSAIGGAWAEGGAITGGVLGTGGAAGVSDTGGAFGTGGTSSVGGSAGSGPGALDGGTTATGGSAGSGGSRPSFPARFVGNIDTRGAVRTDFSQYWDQFTPENAGKWPSVQAGGMNSFNWKSLDAMYLYAEEHDIVFKESSFIWGSAQPSWINNSNVVEVAPIWMKAFCERYPNTRLIDVVNEPLHMTPSYATGLGGGGRTTWEWVANSFKMAREACPNAVLIVNDYNICEYENDNQAVLALVKAIQALGAPVDAIGCQAHDAAKVSVSKFKHFLDTLASETGLPVYITEYDIGLLDDEAQRVQYADYFTMFWDNPHVKGVTIYGYITGATWRANTGIMSSDGIMRPAMSWLMDFLER